MPGNVRKPRRPCNSAFGIRTGAGPPRNPLSAAGYFPVRVSPGLCRRPRPGSDLARSASLLSHVNAEPDLGPRFPHRLCLVAVAPVQLLGGFEGDRGEILEIRARGDVVQALDPDPALAGPIRLLLNPVALGLQLCQTRIFLLHELFDNFVRRRLCCPDFAVDRRADLALHIEIGFDAENCDQQGDDADDPFRLGNQLRLDVFGHLIGEVFPEFLG